MLDARVCLVNDTVPMRQTSSRHHIPFSSMRVNQKIEMLARAGKLHIGSEPVAGVDLAAQAGVVRRCMIWRGNRLVLISSQLPEMSMSRDTSRSSTQEP